MHGQKLVQYHCSQYWQWKLELLNMDRGNEPFPCYWFLLQFFMCDECFGISALSITDQANKRVTDHHNALVFCVDAMVGYRREHSTIHRYLFRVITLAIDWKSHNFESALIKQPMILQLLLWTRVKFHHVISHFSIDIQIWQLFQRLPYNPGLKTHSITITGENNNACRRRRL